MHHFKLYVIPQGTQPKRNADGEYIDGFLIPVDVPNEITQRFRSLLPNPNPWNGVEEFNSNEEWGSDLRIYHDERRISDIVFRYSPAGDPIGLLQSFIDIVKLAGLQLFSDATGDLIPPDFDNLFAIFRQHRAYRFPNDPVGVIKEAADEQRRKR